MESAEVKQKVDAVVSKANSVLSDFYSKIESSIKKDKNKSKPQSVKDVSRTVKPCGISEQIEDISEEDRQIAMSTIKNITSEIAKNKKDFGGVDLGDRGDDEGSRDVGDDEGEVKIVNVGKPKWVQELEKSISSKLKRVKKKEYFDVEGLMRGVTRKKTERGMKKTDFLYFMLDVSGSMSGFSYRGVPLVALLASYIPVIAKKYEGMWIQVDGTAVIPRPLKELSKGEIKTMILAGGGGAAFDGAMEWVVNHAKENKVENPIVVMASDAHEDFSFPIPPNTVFLTTSEGWDYSVRADNGLTRQGFPDELKGQKVVIVDIDKKD